MTRIYLFLAFVLAVLPARALAQPDQDIPPVTVSVTSTPSGASVEIVGRGSVGRTPQRRLRLAPGDYQFVFTKRGYARTVVNTTVNQEGQAIAAELPRAATLVVRADHLPARGATIRIDGELVGRVPTRVPVAPGRRLMEAEAEGFLLFARWVELEAGRTETVNVRLDPRPPDVGSIFVTADVANAEVFIDGTSRGRTPAIVEGLTPGQHHVEVVAADGARVERMVDVRADARENLAVELASRPEPTGSAQIRTEPPGADVLIDGQPRGRTPLSVADLTVGAHRIEISLDGFVQEQRVITIAAGAPSEIDVTLSRGEPRPGRIVVRVAREDVFVVVDGLSRGRAPLTLEHVRPGTHEVRIVAGTQTLFESQCVINFGETCMFEPQLGPAAIPVQVTATVDERAVANARLRIDGGEPVAVPWQGALEIGEHELVVEVQGIEPESRRVTLAAAMEPQRIVFALSRPAPVTEPVPEPTPEPPPEVPAEPVIIPFVPRGGAGALPSGSGTVALLLGWPFIAGAEVIIGLPEPADLGLAVRTFGRVTEIELGSRIGARLADFFALGVQLRLGGGFGPDDINAFTGRLDGRITFFLIADFAVTAWVALDLSSDQYPFSEEDSSIPLSGPRQELARGRLGGSLDWRVAPEWSLSLRVEGIFASTGDRRRLYGDVLEIGNRDTQVYGELAALFHWR